MAKPWAELSSAERLDAILLAVHELDEASWGRAHAGAVAQKVGSTHPMDLAGWGKNGHSNGLRRMSLATRVTPGITALRRRGLLVYGERSDGMSGGCDHLTAAGQARVRELRSKESPS
jgi:broad specificity phosphatase PhoE